MVIPTSVKGIKQCGSEIVDNSNMQEEQKVTGAMKTDRWVEILT